MKKLFGVLVMILGLSAGLFAQDKDKTEIKKTATVEQKVHNTFSKHKKHNGYKVKKKRPSGHKTVHKVNDKTETVKDKSKKAGQLEKKVEETHK